MSTLTKEVIELYKISLDRDSSPLFQYVEFQEISYKRFYICNLIFLLTGLISRFLTPFNV